MIFMTYIDISMTYLDIYDIYLWPRYLCINVKAALCAAREIEEHA